MTIRVEDDIKDLLYESASVVVPGLGAFKGSYKSSSTDGIQGVITPPSLDVSFDPNLVINDGVLIDFLKKKYQTSTQDAQKAIDTFIESANSTFTKHELLVIPQVGRLYRDHTEKIQFLPDNTNFNIDTFGLPVAQFYPVSRTMGEKSAAVEAILNEAEPIIPKKALPENAGDIKPPILNNDNTSITLVPTWRRFIPFVTIGILAILAYTIYTNSRNNRVKAYQQAEESVKINESPTTPVTDAPDVPAVVDYTTLPPATQDKPIANEKMVDKPQSTDNNAAITNVPQQTATVMLGGYADKNNISRHVKWITANGWTVIQKKGNAMTLLGAEVPYLDKLDLQKSLRKMRGRFGDAVQLKRS